MICYTARITRTMPTLKEIKIVVAMKICHSDSPGENAYWPPVTTAEQVNAVLASSHDYIKMIENHH